MATRLFARPAKDPAEERTLRKLAAARHAPASWVQRAAIITGSWDGATVAELADRLGCRTKTVSKWLHRFNTAGVDGLADLPRPGIPRRLGETERGRITALARNSPHYQQFLHLVEQANPTGKIVVITDNLSSHTSWSTRHWLVDHPRIQQVFIPTRACWLNLQEGWWRLFRRTALAGHSFATPEEIILATHVATCQLNARAHPWVWGRPAPPARHLRRRFTTESKERSTNGGLLVGVHP